MNIFTQLVFLVIALTIVKAESIADFNTDVQCVRDKVSALDGLTDDQLVNLTQQNLITATQMVSKRSEIARTQGLTCYYDFNTAYGPGVLNILGPKGEPTVLELAQNEAQREDAIKQIATMTQMIICDEQYRARHVNDSVECSLLDRSGGASAQFALKLPLLTTIMGFGGTALNRLSPPMASVVTQIQELYKELYATAKTCSQNIADPNQSCRNLKMFVNELDRLGELGSIVAASKLP